MIQIEYAILTGYLERSGSGSIGDGEGFGEGPGFVVREGGNGVSGVGRGIAGDGARESSDDLTNENVSGTSTLSCSVAVSSEIGHVSGCIGRREIYARSCGGLLEGGIICIGDNSDLVSCHVGKPLRVVYTPGFACVGGSKQIVGADIIGITSILEKAVHAVFNRVSFFEVSHELCLLLFSVDRVDVSSLILGIEGVLVDVDGAGDELSEVSLVGEDSIVVGFDGERVFGEWVHSGFEEDDPESTLEGLDIGDTYGVSGTSVEVLDGDDTDRPEDREDGDSDEELDEGEAVVVSGSLRERIFCRHIWGMRKYLLVGVEVYFRVYRQILKFS